MSYNRGRGGYRQDSRQSYGRSNMGQHLNQRGSLNVSPWECGVAPNAALSRAGLQSLLPSPPQLQTNSNILSQQQHALVMASNLLSNLGLLPQQQGQQHRSQQDLPSLMNVRTLGNSQQYRLSPQNYNTHGSSRYGNLPPMRRNKPLESHRVEPYKNHRGRAAASQAQQPGRRFPPSKPAGNKPAVSANANSVKSKKPAKAAAAAAAAPPTDAVEGGEVESEPIEEKSGEDLVAVKGEEDDEAKREPGEEDDAKKKRDWKAEKAADEVKMEVDEPGKEAEEVEEVAAEDEAPAEVAADGKAKTGKFQCHVCNRHVSDEQALKSHLALKSHSTKMARLDASYKARAEEMRAAMKRAVQGARKPAGGGGRDYCKMCDLNFFGTIVNHRKNEAHLQLKTFLHPRCGTCAREFPTRMEWDLHKLTVSHQVRERKRDDTRQPTSSGVASARAEGGSGASKSAHRSKAGMSCDATYDPQAPVGMEHLATGQHCRLCEKFFERRYDAKLHCMTEEHFNLCLAKAKEAALIESERLKKEEEEKAAAKEAATEESPVVVAADLVEKPVVDEVVDLDNEPGSDEEEGTDEGNWKRRRIADMEDSPTKVPIGSGAEPYNPLEATEEDEVVQIAESPELLEEVQGDILEALDREIGDILETAGDVEGNSNGIKEGEEEEVEEEEEKKTPKVVTPGSRGRRGGRGTATRARKRKC